MSIKVQGIRPALYQRGVSLIEIVVFTIVVGIAVAAITEVFSTTTRANADPLLRRQALAVAQALMEEISYKEFSNPPNGFTGPYTPVNRAKFDDVMDYNGFSMNGIVYLDGTPIPGLGQYQVQVAAVPEAFGPVPIGQGLKITITVTDPIGEELVLDGYRANYY